MPNIALSVDDRGPRARRRSTFCCHVARRHADDRNAGPPPSRSSAPSGGSANRCRWRPRRSCRSPSFRSWACSPSAKSAPPTAIRWCCLFMGGFMLAQAAEHSGAHRRMAHAIVAAIGRTSGRRLVLAFMIATAFTSMWVSNTAAALMMLPVAMAVLECDESGRLGVPLLLGHRLQREHRRRRHADRHAAQRRVPGRLQNGDRRHRAVSRVARCSAASSRC